jgi:hypothetical protein
VNSLLRCTAWTLTALGVALMTTGTAIEEATLFVLAGLVAAVLALSFTVTDAITHLAVVIDDATHAPDPARGIGDTKALRSTR